MDEITKKLTELVTNSVWEKVEKLEVVKQYDNGDVLVTFESVHESLMHGAMRTRRAAFIQASYEGFKREGFRWSNICQ